MRIDLHAHSTESDGTETPARLVEAAHSAGMDVLAITDHDSTAGWDEAAAEAERLGIGLVRGIELSCAHRGTSVHCSDLCSTPRTSAYCRSWPRHAKPGNRARRIVERLA